MIHSFTVGLLWSSYLHRNHSTEAAHWWRCHRDPAHPLSPLTSTHPHIHKHTLSSHHHFGQCVSSLISYLNAHTLTAAAVTEDQVKDISCVRACNGDVMVLHNPDLVMRHAQTAPEKFRNTNCARTCLKIRDG